MYTYLHRLVAAAKLLLVRWRRRRGLVRTKKRSGVGKEEKKTQKKMELREPASPYVRVNILSSHCSIINEIIKYFQRCVFSEAELSCAVAMVVLCWVLPFKSVQVLFFFSFAFRISLFFSPSPALCVKKSAMYAI